MPPLTDIAEKHARMLGELAEFGLNLARKLHDQAMAAETSEETADLAKAFHAVSRTLRQTMLLETRVAREAEGLAVDARKAVEKERKTAEDAARAPIENRRNRIAHVIDRITGAECEDEDEAYRIYEEVLDRLDDDKLAPDFLDQPIDDQIARLCQEFGLPLPERPVERPRDPEASPPPRPLDPDPHDWRLATRIETRPQPA